MSETNDTPTEEHDSIEQWRNGEVGFPCREETDEDLALVLEGRKTEAKEAVDAVTRALLNDSEPLTDRKAVRLARAAEALQALSQTTMLRVPDEEREDEDT